MKEFVQKKDSGCNAAEPLKGKMIGRLFRQRPGEPCICNVQGQVKSFFFTGFYDCFSGFYRIGREQLYSNFVSNLQVADFPFCFNVDFNNVILCHAAVINGVTGAYQWTVFIGWECCIFVQAITILSKLIGYAAISALGQNNVGIIHPSKNAPKPSAAHPGQSGE